MTLSVVDVDVDVEHEIVRFINRESALLNKRRFAEWLDIVTEDFTYTIPTPILSDNPQRSHWSESSSIVDETRASLVQLWFSRYMEENREFAWGENPAQRVRRFISGTVVTAGDSDDEYVAESNELLSFVHQTVPVVLVPAGRIDLIRRTETGFKLAKRVVQIDQTLQTLTHVRVLF